MTTPSSPYEQGYRDALLTVKASIETFCDLYRRVNSDPSWGVEQIGNRVDSLIDEKNHDQWSLLALARADLSKHPETEVLRSMLRAPTGMLIDARGRILLLRLNGVEYETGVLDLLEQLDTLNAPLAQAGAPRALPSITEADARLGEPRPAAIESIVINGRKRYVYRYAGRIEFEQILDFADLRRDAAVRIAYRCQGDSGIINPGQAVECREGMEFTIERA